MWKIRLADGSEIPAERCAVSEGVLCILLPEPMDVVAAVGVFGSPICSERITFIEDDERETTYDGYTHVISTHESGVIQLRREVI